MIISLSGPSGIGKGYIKEKILQIYPFIEELAWFTTRPLRPNESGNRISIPEHDFENLALSGKLVLIQNLYGCRYGLRKESLASRAGAYLTELHPNNLRAALEINSQIIAIGLVTFDFDFLRRRLSDIRKTENAEEIDRRMTQAQSEISTIIQLQSLFEIVIEVTENSQLSISNQVLLSITPHIKKGQQNVT